jgi:hypothetical protein
MEKMITIPLSEYEGLKKLVEQLHEELSLLKQSRDSSVSSTSPSQDQEVKSPEDNPDMQDVIYQ